MTSLTPYLDVPLPELVAQVTDGDTGLTLAELDVVVAEYCLRVEATGTRASMLDAAEAMHDLSAWAAKHNGGTAASRWGMLAEHLTDRASRSDPIGVDALLRSQNGKPRRLLELLAAAPGGSLPRAELAAELVAGESHVSHVLSSLYDAGLVHRHRSGRQVTVTLAARGRELLGAGAAPTNLREMRLFDGLTRDRRARLEGGRTRTPVFALPA